MAHGDYVTTFDALTDEDIKGWHAGPGNTYGARLRIGLRALNYQIEKHTTGSVVATGGSGGGYSGGFNTEAAVTHMNTVATASRAYVVPCTENGVSLVPANCFARLVYRTDASPGTAVELATWTALNTGLRVRTALTLAVTAIPASAIVYFEFSVPNTFELQASGHLDLIRTGIPA